MDRRQFIKVTAATSATATLAGCGNPEHQLIRFVPDEELVPGVSIWRPSICPLCPAGCGVLARVVEGDAEIIRNNQAGIVRMGLVKKLEGNPAHPISQGKLCVRGQAAIQTTYHPDRVAHPLKRTGERGVGPFKEITWDEALAELVSKLDGLAAANNQKQLAFLSRPLSGQRRTLVDMFLSRYGAQAPMTFEVFGEQVLRRANAMSFGYEQLPTIDLGRSSYVVAFGADFLGTWNSPVAQSVGYGQMRQGTPGRRAKFVHVEPRMSQTGANADEWIPAKPGTEGILALGIAHVMMHSGLRKPEAAGRAGAQIEGWFSGLANFAPRQVAERTGIAVARIERLAREFAEHSPAVALIGQAPLAHTNGLANALAVNALNALGGSVGAPGGIAFTPRLNFNPILATISPQGRPFDRAAAEAIMSGASPAQALLVYEANPVFGTPPSWRVKEALLQIPYIASFGTFLDETSVLADLILPDHSFLESWMDDAPESGTAMAVVSVAPPAMKPIHQTRAMPDVLLEVGGKLAKPFTPALPWQTYEEMLKAALSMLPKTTAPSGESVDVWTKAKEQGGWWGELPSSSADGAVDATRAVALTDAQFDGDPAGFPFHFLPYASQAFLDGSLAHLPWLQELPDVLSTAMWSSWIEINPKTAATLKIAQGDLVEISSSAGKLRVPALISPGIAPDVVAMPVGQGHEKYTRYASGRGTNPIAILAHMTDSETGAFAWAATRVRIAKVEGKGDLVLFAGGMREHDPEHEHR